MQNFIFKAWYKTQLKKVSKHLQANLCQFIVTLTFRGFFFMKHTFLNNITKSDKKPSWPTKVVVRKRNEKKMEDYF